MNSEAEYRIIDGEKYLSEGNYSRAIEEFITVIKGGLNTSRVRNNLAIAYAKTGFFDKAIDELKQAVKIDPGNKMARNNLGIAVCEQSKKYIEDGKVDIAVNLLISVSELIPNNPLPFSSLGIICSLKDKKAEAVKLFNKALKLCNSSEFNFLKPKIEAELKELEKSSSE